MSRSDHGSFAHLTSSSSSRPPTSNSHSMNHDRLYQPMYTAPYKQRSMGNSYRSPFATLAAKSHSLAGRSLPSTSTDSKAIDIVLLGETGVGKSSLINWIAGENVVEVSPDTMACTKIPVEYTFEEKGRTFNLYDTPGLVDPQMGVESFINPIDTIQKLIHGLGNGNGPDLVLFCVENSKPTASLQRNYRLFCNVICEGKVSFALAIMKLEEGRNADEWWHRYKTTIRTYGVDCSGYFGFGREKRHSGPNADPGGQLRVSFSAFLVACTNRQKNRTTLLRSSMERVVVSVASLLRAQVWTLEKILMNQCGLEEETARELAKRITSSRESCNDRVHT